MGVRTRGHDLVAYLQNHTAAIKFMMRDHLSFERHRRDRRKFQAGACTHMAYGVLSLWNGLLDHQLD